MPNDKVNAFAAERGMLKNWVALQAGLQPQDINDDDLLIGGDYLDSFALISLICSVEEILERPLSDRESEPTNFLSINAIVDNIISSSGNKICK